MQKWKKYLKKDYDFIVIAFQSKCLLFFNFGIEYTKLSTHPTNFIPTIWEVTLLTKFNYYITNFKQVQLSIET